MSQKHDFQKLERLIEDWKKIPANGARKTIMDVIGYGYHENIASNILAFYFQPSEEHTLGNLFFNTLMDLVLPNQKADSIDEIQIKRERVTSRGNRIDLLIETERHVIGIENKIFHVLNNDLSDYRRFLENMAKKRNKKAIGIVLSLRNLSANEISAALKEKFIIITYKDFLEKIKMRIGSDKSDSCGSPHGSIWNIFLANYITNLEKFIKTMNAKNASETIDKKLISFCRKYTIEINELLNMKIELNKQFKCCTENLEQIILSKLKSADMDKNVWTGKGSPTKTGVSELDVVLCVTNRKLELKLKFILTYYGWKIIFFSSDITHKEAAFIAEKMKCRDAEYDGCEEGYYELPVDWTMADSYESIAEDAIKKLQEIRHIIIMLLMGRNNDR